MQNPIPYVEVEIIDVIREAFLGCCVFSLIKFHKALNLQLPAL